MSNEPAALGRAFNLTFLHRWLPQAKVVAGAAAGGALCTALSVPGGWMSGAMVSVAAMAAAGQATVLNAPLRKVAMVASGSAIGAAISPEMLHHMSRYPASIGIMAAAVIAITAIGIAMLRQMPGFSRETAFFASVPGALSYVFVVAAETKADLARIAVIQTLRIFFLMAILPMILTGVGMALAAPGGRIDDPLGTVALCFAAGFALGTALDRLGVAGGMLFGAMIASGILHGFGMAPGRSPAFVIIVGQILVGAWSGSRFVGFDWGLLGRLALVSLASFAGTMGVAAAFAGLGSHILALPFPAMLLAFAPGGLDTMTLLAFALGIDPLFVAVHHLARFVGISLTLPIVARLWFGRELE